MADVVEGVAGLEEAAAEAEDVGVVAEAEGASPERLTTSRHKSHASERKQAKARGRTTTVEINEPRRWQEADSRDDQRIGYSTLNRS